jgi:hypothetical protein
MNFIKKESFEIFKLEKFEDEQLIRYFLFQLGKNTVKGTTMTKVGILTKDCILHMSYMYWSIKYQTIF